MGESQERYWSYLAAVGRISESSRVRSVVRRVGRGGVIPTQRLWLNTQQHQLDILMDGNVLDTDKRGVLQTAGDFIDVIVRTCTIKKLNIFRVSDVRAGFHNNKKMLNFFLTGTSPDKQIPLLQPFS